MESLSKAFPGQMALSGVELELHGGRVLGLVGQNGSGKSTLIKVLAGYHPPDPGAMIEFEGERHALTRDGGSWRSQIRFIHQDLGLVPSLDSLDNLALGTGYSTGRLARIRWRAEERRARELLAEFDLDLDLRTPVARLSAVERTVVAVVRALRGWDGSQGVLVLDEPTAALTTFEVERLFGLIRRVAARGAAVVFVSHRLNEVLELADDVAVLRDGRMVACRPRAELDEAGLVELITGQPMGSMYTAPPQPGREVVLAARSLTGSVLDDVSFDLHLSEVLGIAGIAGSGREELSGLLFGADPRAGGAIELDGEPLEVRSPRAAIARGLALVPADRAVRGVIGAFSIRENLTLPRLPSRWRRGPISSGRERREAGEWISRLDVRPPEPERPVIRLSGGNQQKVVLAKWLRTNPRVLILDEPTQGVDVGAKAGIYERLAGAAGSGVAVLLCSSEPEELAHMCDRVLVLRRGRIGAELWGDALTADRIVAEALSDSAGVAA